MVNFKFIGIAIVLLIIGGYKVYKNKFYKRKEHDMLWATGSNVFFGYVVVIIFALLIIYYELKKLF